MDPQVQLIKRALESHKTAQFKRMQSAGRYDDRHLGSMIAEQAMSELDATNTLLLDIQEGAFDR